MTIAEAVAEVMMADMEAEADMADVEDVEDVDDEMVSKID